MSENAVPRRRLGRLPLALLCLTAALASVTSIGTYALWNDASTVAGATVTSGRLDLKANVGAGDVDNVASWTGLQLTDMAPGESKAATLTVRNSGTVPFAVAVTGSAVGAELAPVMTVRAHSGAAGPADTTYPRTEACPGTALAPATPLNGTQNVVPTAAAVTVQPGATSSLCLVATLPTAADNAVQGKSWTPTFTLTATQS